MPEAAVIPCRELSLGELNGIGIFLRTIEDSRPAELSRESIHSLVHLEVIPAWGKYLTMEQLRHHNLDTAGFREIYECCCEKLRSDALRNHFVPGLRLENMGRIMHGVHVTPSGEVHLRFILGHRDLMAQLWPGHLWTGTPFVKES